MLETQKITTVTVIKLDFWDRVRIFFGNVIKVTVHMEIPQQAVIHSFNAKEKVEIESSTQHTFKKDKPDFGWVTGK